MTNYRRPGPQGFNHDRAFHDRIVAEGGKRDEYAGPDTPAAHVRRYEANHVDQRDPDAFSEGGIKVWSQAPWKGQGDDPRGFKHHDRDGVPIVTSRREVDEVIARTREHATPLLWERD